MDACPVEAIFKDPKTGAIQIDDEICVGCRACTVVCPFGAIFISEEKKIAVVCDMCGGDPECVKWCPKDAIKFVEEKQVNRFVKRVRLEKMTETMLEARSKILEKFPKY
jgi:Fe-S-cluster-containing hydrogenase component 2